MPEEKKQPISSQFVDVDMKDLSDEPVPPPKLNKEVSISSFALTGIVPVDELDLSGEDRRTYEMLSERINDYREACLYMRNVIGNEKKAKEFHEISETLKKIL